MIYKGKETDRELWFLEQVELIDNGKIKEADIYGLLDYLAESSATEIHSVESLLDNLQMHLLKWKYQPERQSGSWKLSIYNKIEGINRVINKRKTIGNWISRGDIFIRSFQKARIKASKETNLPLIKFPINPEWTLDNILDINWINKFLEENKKKG